MILVDRVVFIIAAKRRGVIVRPAAPPRQLNKLQRQCELPENMSYGTQAYTQEDNSTSSVTGEPRWCAHLSKATCNKDIFAPSTDHRDHYILAVMHSILHQPMLL